MTRILNYELKSLFLGKRKNNLFIGILLLSLAYLALALSNNIPDGLTALGEGLSFYSSIMVFLSPLFAGLFLSQSFEERMIQNSIMSGQTKTNIVIGKSLHFFLLCILFLLLPTLISTLIITVIKGWNTTGVSISLATLLIQALLFMMLVATTYMIVVPIAFYFKKMGPTIGVGLFVSILVYSLTQELIQRESLQSILKWTPIGNSYFVFNETELGLIDSLVVIILWTGIYILITWLLFRKEELK